MLLEGTIVYKTGRERQCVYEVPEPSIEEAAESINDISIYSDYEGEFPIDYVETSEIKSCICETNLLGGSGEIICRIMIVLLFEPHYDILLYVTDKKIKNKSTDTKKYFSYVKSFDEIYEKYGPDF